MGYALAQNTLTPADRRKKANQLLSLMGTAPGYIFDPVLYALSGESHFDPIKAETLLEKRGFRPQTRHVFCISKGFFEDVEEGLGELIARAYGQRAAALAEELI